MHLKRNLGLSSLTVWLGEAFPLAVVPSLFDAVK